MSVRVGFFLATLLFASRADAHALDEYVQALRVGVSADWIEVTLDLTPGVNIAVDVLRLIDGDGDGVISANEAESYGRRVLADVATMLDARHVTPRLTRVEVPTAGELRSGSGVIRVRATIDVRSTTGAHRLHIVNTHLPSISVYLANALVPDDVSVHIRRQSRDVQQQTYVLDYEREQLAPAASAWLLTALIVVGTLVTARTCA